MTTPRCAACGHERLLGPYEINNADLNFYAPEVRQGFFAKPLLVQPTRARVCAGCGHFSVYLDEATLALLRGG
jgi:hypothetical protein